ncbi:Cloroperoxidase [Plenodomus tracheiphilus IPT5]|uniref:Cloroperoxidase n=1 Tax=Plenodomus tracheiphilus IPT5 TaxID=1408161 RepID=A0A6A7B766_9PLEO|nr:Cloroperoxidase [Plenodomus tracheiphilus IPT5]
MKLTTFVVASTATLASARPQYGAGPADAHAWIPQGEGDFRGPCPMLNTLTNHGFLPRDGRNFTKPNVIKGLKDGINFNETLGGIMWDQAIIANPEPNATFFTLEMLNVHNVLEHDASLSRSDAYFGNNHVFNETAYNRSKKWWTSDPVTAKELANSKIYRQLESRADNPNYTFSASTEEFSLGEVAAPPIAFGDILTGDVPRPLITFFFENEKLPYELGWTKKEDPITLEKILHMTSVIRNATSLLTGGATPAEGSHEKRDLHAGLFQRSIH